MKVAAFFEILSSAAIGARHTSDSGGLILTHRSSSERQIRDLLLYRSITASIGAISY